jgi:hypothetical protein
MENQRKTWGKSWTYTVMTGVLLAGYALTWYLVEKRRDNDAAQFYKVSKANEEQIWNIKRYVETMPDGDHKANLMEILDPIYIVRTRAEMDSIHGLKDSVSAQNGF